MIYFKPSRANELACNASWFYRSARAGIAISEQYSYIGRVQYKYTIYLL